MVSIKKFIVFVLSAAMFLPSSAAQSVLANGVENVALDSQRVEKKSANKMIIGVGVGAAVGVPVGILLGCLLCHADSDLLLRGSFDESLFDQGEKIYFRQFNPNLKPHAVYIAGRGETLDSIYMAFNIYYGGADTKLKNEYYSLNARLQGLSDLTGKHVQIPFWLAYVASRQAPAKEKNLKKMEYKLDACCKKANRWTMHVTRLGGNSGFELVDPNKRR